MQRTARRRQTAAQDASFWPESWVLPGDTIAPSAFKDGPLILKPDEGRLRVPEYPCRCFENPHVRRHAGAGDSYSHVGTRACAEDGTGKAAGWLPWATAYARCTHSCARVGYVCDGFARAALGQANDVTAKKGTGAIATAIVQR